MAVNEVTLKRRSENVMEPDVNSTITDRVRYLIVSLRKTQQQFAEMIGMDGPNLSRILNGKVPFSDAMVNRIVVNLGVSKEWLVNGSDIPFAKSHPHQPHTLDGDLQPGTVNRHGEGAPIYDIDVTAGYGELSTMFTDERIVGYLQLPQVNPNNSIVRVSGDSMTPQIPNGAWISIRRIDSHGTIFWGQTYLVYLEDYRMVKVLRRHDDPSKVILHSVNPDYDDMEINRSEIKALFIIDAVINYNLLA